MKLMCTY